LFEIGRPAAEECLLIYRAQMKTEKLKGRAFLEMWCALGGLEFFSKGLFNPVSGSTDWATYEIPFRLEKGQKPESIKLNVTIEGMGTLWIKDITLRKSPLPANEGPAKPKTDESLIQGTWRVVRGYVKGKAVPDVLIQTLNPHVTLSGNKISWNVGPGTPLPNLEGVFHLDASKTPKTMDIVVFDKAKNQRMVVLGIYKLEGDALEICHAVEPSQPAERPKEFKTDPESFVGHVVLKREKPAKDRPAPDKTDQELPRSSGPQVGEKVAGFLPVHLNGQHEGQKSDLVEQWGGDPVVLVFTRELSGPLVSLITKTSAAIGQHKAAKLRGAVVFLGDDDWLTDRRLLGLMADTKLKEIVLALDKAAGPADYKLHKDAGVTALLYTRQTVKANFKFANGQMTDADVTKILADLPKILPAK
jgi:uncharacterized protein (TIGR03067 family)